MQIDDSGATRVRAALPKYVLRGVSGATFGKTFPVVAPTVIGRQHDCDIAIASEEISRRHAQVKPTPDGLLVEDLGSSNGTYINGSRVQSGLLKAGDELRLDAVRFMLVVPGKEIPNTNAHAPSTTSAPAQVRQGNAGMITGIIIAARRSPLRPTGLHCAESHRTPPSGAAPVELIEQAPVPAHADTAVSRDTTNPSSDSSLRWSKHVVLAR